MMSKEFLKKLGVLGVTMGLTASPLALAQQTQQDEYESNTTSTQQSGQELDEGADNLPGTQEDPVDRTFDKTESGDVQHDAANQPDELDTQNGASVSGELDEGADNLPGTQEDPVDRTFDQTEPGQTQHDAANQPDEADAQNGAGVSGELDEGDTEIPGTREDPVDRTFEKGETDSEDEWD